MDKYINISSLSSEWIGRKLSILDRSEFTHLGSKYYTLYDMIVDIPDIDIIKPKYGSTKIAMVQIETSIFNRNVNYKIMNDSTLRSSIYEGIVSKFSRRHSAAILETSLFPFKVLYVNKSRLLPNISAEWYIDILGEIRTNIIHKHIKIISKRKESTDAGISELNFPF